MKQGIHLGAAVSGRRRVLKGFLLWLTIIITIAHLLVILMGYQRIEELRQEVIEVVSVGDWVDENEVDPDYQGTLAIVGSVMSTGRLEAVSPITALSMLAEHLPASVRLASLKLDPSSPNPTLTLTAVARERSVIGPLQSALGKAPMVESTIILEERSVEGGFIAVRIQLGLRVGGQDRGP